MADEIDRFLEAYTPEIRDLTHQVRALIASITPDADEYLKAGWKVIWYGFGPKMPDQFAVVMPTRNHVGLGFAYGSDLPDPKGKLEGTGKRMRHVKLRSSADAADPAIAALLRAQVALLRAERAAPRSTKTAAARPKAAPRPRAGKKTARAASPRRKKASARPGARAARAR
jgi:hypothetical protein